ncbi:MAG: sigma-70 family RNA polymerase sigma factor [Flavobacteriales bacterium]|nr:sigma-70 family RNA polymerase sigma factor [Flavobacteriales bacterium]
MDEITLVSDCLKGNPKAQKAFFDKFAPKMMTVCLRYMKSSEEAEDMLQDAMIKVFHYLDRYKNEGSLEGWIRRIIVNTCLDQIRKNSKLIGVQSTDDVEYKLTSDDKTLEHMPAAELLNLIQKMPDGYRVVFNMFAIEGFSHQEIAQHLNITESTSKSQYLRARAYLRERIEKK